jgi:hypothetical protein
MERHHFTQPKSLEERLAEEARRLRKEAQGTPPGIERDTLIRKARQAETGAHMSEWLRSPGLQPPRWPCPMKDFRSSIEKLRTDAAEAALIRDLATDWIKREMYDRLHQHLNRLADEVEQAMNPITVE